MASIYRNGNRYWLKGRHTRTGEPIRFSLETPDAARAGLLLRKWEAWSELFTPEFGDPEFPAKMREFLVGTPTGFASLLAASVPASPAKPPKPLNAVLQKYLAYCRTQHSAHHAANTTSRLKAAFGKSLEEAGPDE